MTDFQSQIVILPAIPQQDVTPLERLLLTAMFDHRVDEHGIHFHSQAGLRERVAFTLAELRTAVQQTNGQSPAALDVLRATFDLATDHGPHIGFDLSITAWEWLLQDIVRRSEKLDHIAVVAGYTCDDIGRYPHALGGIATVVTADQLAAKSLDECLIDLQVDLLDRSWPPAPNTRIISPVEADVRSTIDDILRVDERVTRTDITEDDIRMACATIASDALDDEARCHAIYDAARGAIDLALARAEPIALSPNADLPLSLKPACRYCANDRIVRDACARWDADTGRWTLADVLVGDFCEACNADGDDLVRWVAADGAPAILCEPVVGARVRIIDPPRFKDHEGEVRFKSAVGVFVQLDDERLAPTQLFSALQLMVISLPEPVASVKGATPEPA
ncbi:MAG: hypothetical protein CVT77_01570 [Alphaproteobacteria bacterium HGW-Alphaproteobacteria-16]|nr:MAG: hypothetical protein CVT77_01570 [Alphaproteobacteria bacterium HGW-Alphaproteobacteria-16]